jgi:branched-chain amino acid transport system substrate-binding protein
MNHRTSGRREKVGGVRLLSILMGLIAGAALSSCGAVQDQAAAQKPTLSIGTSLSLTGDFSDTGHAVERGYEVWVDSVNADGGVLGRPVTLKVVDDASKPEQAAANYEKLITVDKVDLVLGPYSSKLTIPSSQVVARHNYAFLEPAGGAPKVFAQHLTNLFFIQPAPIVQQGGVFADYILSLPLKQRPKTASYTALEDPFAQPLAAFVQKRFETAGIKTVSEQTYAEDADLNPVMAKVAAAHPEVLIAATQPEDGYAAVRALIKLRWAPKWLFLSGGANEPVQFPAKVGAANVDGVFTSGDWFPGSNASGSADFLGAYLSKYGGNAGEIANDSVEAYSAGLLLQQVAKKTGRIDNETIIKTLHDGTWLTPIGDLSWDADGAPKGSYLLLQWIDGKLQSVYPPGRQQNVAKAGPLPWSK